MRVVWARRASPCLSSRLLSLKETYSVSVLEEGSEKGQHGWVGEQRVNEEGGNERIRASW
jgi:hypothetical protein